MAFVPALPVSPCGHLGCWPHAGTGRPAPIFHRGSRASAQCWPHLTHQFPFQAVFLYSLETKYLQNQVGPVALAPTAGQPWLGNLFNHAPRVFMLAVPGGKAAFVPTTAWMPRNRSDPGHHPVPQPGESTCLMDLPSYFPTSGIYLQHTHFPSRRHYQKLLFLAGKAAERGAGRDLHTSHQKLL